MSGPLDDWFSGCLPALTGFVGLRNAANDPRIARGQQQAYTGGPHWYAETVTVTAQRRTTSCKGCGAPVEDRCEYCGRHV